MFLLPDYHVLQEEHIHETTVILTLYLALWCHIQLLSLAIPLSFLYTIHLVYDTNDILYFTDKTFSDT